MSQLVKTKRQANLKGFKRFGAFKGSSNKKTLYSTRSCVNWAFFGTRGPLKCSFHSRFKMAHSCQKDPIYTQTHQINYYYLQLVGMYLDFVQIKLHFKIYLYFS
jgi:hypothetical protein